MNEQILKEQILELTKLLELKDMRIKELEALRTIPSLITPFQVPYVDKTNGIEKTIQVTCSSGGCIPCQGKCGSK